MDSAVAPQTREHLLATLREALSNVVRHADATSVDVDLRVADAVVLTVRDDGRGFAPGGRESGLLNMRQRAEALDGTCIIGSQPGKGTELTWTVPFSRRSGTRDHGPDRRSRPALGLHPSGEDADERD